MRKTLRRWARPWGGVGRSRTAKPWRDTAGLPAALGYWEGDSQRLGSLEAAGLYHGMGAPTKAKEFREKPAINVSTKVILSCRSATGHSHIGEQLSQPWSMSVWINWYQVLVTNDLDSQHSEDRKASSFPGPVTENLPFVRFHFYTEWFIQVKLIFFLKKETFFYFRWMRKI